MLPKFFDQVHLVNDWKYVLHRLVRADIKGSQNIVIFLNGNINLCCLIINC